MDLTSCASPSPSPNPIPLLVGLCVYQCAKGLPDVFRNLCVLQSSTRVPIRLHLIVFYDVCTDTSKHLLDTLFAPAFPDMILVVRDRRPTHVRTTNIATARNGILDVIRNHPLYSQTKLFPFFAMMDTNEYSCVGPIVPEPIQDMLTTRVDEWDSVSFDRQAGYYDYWALSFDPFVYSFFHYRDFQKVVAAMRKQWPLVLQQHAPGAMIPVWSAYNGFALYKSDIFLSCSYDSNIDLSLFPPMDTLYLPLEIRTGCYQNDCEHRHFHMEAIRRFGARIRVCNTYVIQALQPPRPGLRGKA